jgi:ACDE family multidrug resistance protein
MKTYVPLSQEQVRFTIIALFCLESVSRGLLLAIVPLRLLSQFGTIERVTYFYAFVAIFALGNSILVPWIINKVGIRAVVVAAGCFISLSAALLATDTFFGVTIGLICRILELACMEIPLFALLMARISRHSLGTFEPIRVFFQGVCISAFPWIGFKLYDQFSPFLPFAISTIGGIIFVILALTMLPQGRSDAPLRPLQPRNTIARFFQQPRLLSAWLLAVIRSSFWSVYFIYAPIFAVSCGWSTSAGAAILSLGLVTLLFVPIWGRLGRKFGVRPVLFIGYAMGGFFLIFAALAWILMPFAAPVFLFGAAFCGSVIDGVGNVPFMRATRPHERTSMTGIYMTYRDLAQFAPIALFTLILSFSQFSSALIAIAVVFFFGAYLALLIHPRIR